MTRKELYKIRADWLDKHHRYSLKEWQEFDYSLLHNIMYRRRSGRGQNCTYNEVIIMADTETSKKKKPIYRKDRKGKPVPCYENHVCAWTISLRAFNRNIVTLYGHDPVEFCDCLAKIHESMQGEETYVYFHNYSYDYVFLRRFLFLKFGTPIKQLNTKPHYPISMEFENGIIIKDSLILAQRSLEKWAKDLNVEHQKAVGKWDYDKIRNQAEQFTAAELEYIEHDTLAGVECIDATMKALNKSLFSLPYTATGIPREQVKARGKENNAKGLYNRICADFDQYLKLTKVYHGGFTHANRAFIDTTIKPCEYGKYDVVQCFDFASSYPFVMLSEKYPMEKFFGYHNCQLREIVEESDNYAFMFKLIAMRPRLKQADNPFPSLQFSKCTKTVNAILDNGRVLCADYIEIYLADPDAVVIFNDYEFDKHICVEVECAEKDYLPRWFTDYVFECFQNKTHLKGGDPVAYSIAKSKVNSLYGLTVQKNVQIDIAEDYETGEFTYAEEAAEEAYEKYIHKIGTILPYHWGCWVTSYAFKNLRTLQGLCDIPIYSDTDSCYGIGWDLDKVKAYNENCKAKLLKNGYGCVPFNGREYWLGIAETEPNDRYTEFRVMGAKRYCGRHESDGQLVITVAGVPKKTGAKCLNDDINNFTKGFIFSGSKTGKLLHTYYFNDIYTDEDGNITGDSIDLSPCDYLLDSVRVVDWESLFFDEIEIQTYE